MPSVTCRNLTDSLKRKESLFATCEVALLNSAAYKPVSHNLLDINYGNIVPEVAIDQLRAVMHVYGHKQSMARDDLHHS